MSIYNHNTKKEIPIRILSAASRLSKMVGLLGAKKSELENQAYFLRDCASIHTFGMNFKLDVYSLDRSGTVLEIVSGLKPNKTHKGLPGTKDILEVVHEGIDPKAIKVGDQLFVQIDEKRPLNFSGVSSFLHWPVNIFIAFLWVNFVLSAVMHLNTNGSFVNYGLLAVNTLLLGLFLTRRPSKDISTRLTDWTISIATVASSMLLKPLIGPNWGANASAIIQGLGVLTINLGRSFGVIPANRKVKKGGAYQIVRHPLYASEMIFYAGFLLGNLSAWNLAMTVLILFGQIYRAIAEESLLSKEKTYKEYMGNVRYRLVPGIF